MLGVVAASGRGTGDALLRAVATALQAQGLRLAGAVQHDTPGAPGQPAAMNLCLLPGMGLLRISQCLGPGAEGCRLDPDGLERAVAAAQAALAQGGADLVIVNKFGKHEAEGRGFRPLIAEALAQGIPVLTAVAPEQAQAFARFAEDLADPLPARMDALLDWCRNACAAR